MFTHHLRAVVTAAALLPTLATAAAAATEAAATPLTLTQALALALERSEATRAARAGVASASEAARAAGQLPDPTLRAGIDNLPVTGADRLSTARDSMTMKRIGIGQEWVSAEKRAARQAAADAMVGRETLSVQAAAAAVRLQTALAYLDAHFAAETLKLATLSEHHLHEELEAARARLSSSTGNGPDVLAATGALGVAEDESADLRQQQSAARAALERWVGTGVETTAAVQAPDGLTAVTEEGYVVKHPAVMAARRDIELARTDAVVAGTNRRPNWSWELAYGQRSGYSNMVSFGVNIPLAVSPAERQDRETAAKLALVDKAEAGLVEATRAAQGEFRSLASDAQRLAERVQRYQAAVVVPGQQRTAAALAGYRSNQVTLLSLFEARHMEVEAQRKLLNLQRDLARAQAQLAFKPLSAGVAP